MFQTKFRLIDPWTTYPPVLPLEALPQSMQVVVAAIKNQPDQETALRYAYEALGQKYIGYRTLTFLRLDRFLVRSLEKLWSLHGFLHCHHMNYLLRTILVASEKFAPKDIEACWTQIWLFSPHQYLKVHLHSGEMLEVDLWGKNHGIRLGDHAHGLHSGSVFTQRNK